MQENQRIRLSKKMLKESLIALLAEDSIHKISVRDICNRAQINRTTFYKYYGSQYDLLKDMEDDVLSQVDTYLSPANGALGDNVERIVKTITFISDNLELCRIMFSNNIDPEFPERLISLPPIRQLIRELRHEYDEEQLAYVFGFIIDGAFNMILRWMNKENREPPEEIAVFLYDTIMKLFPVPGEV